MSFKLKFDDTIGMCRSVGDWPNGVLMMDLENPCEPSFAVDWHFQPEPLPQGMDPGESISMQMESPKKDFKARIEIEEVVQGCHSLKEAMAIWMTACSVVIKQLQDASLNPPQLHEAIHGIEFLIRLNDALGDEAHYRDEDGKRIE